LQRGLSALAEHLAVAVLGAQKARVVATNLTVSAEQNLKIEILLDNLF